jgi:DNA-binding NtrC family response regulator
MSDTLLIVEDEGLLREELARHYRREGWDVMTTADLASARGLLVKTELNPLVVLSDMSLPDGNALDLLEQSRAAGGTAEWIVFTGFGTVPDSVRALRLGAFDFVEKPVSTERLDLIVAGAARSARAQRRLGDEASHRNQRYTVGAFLGTSPAAREVRDLLTQLSGVPLSALVIAGETGTGKGLVARILHHSGLRSSGPLVELNCAALPAELLESELFGHEPGAFTGAQRRHRGLVEQASGGTLFLDEIGDMRPELQAKLLKVLEDQRIRRLGGEKELDVDVQVFSASNRDLSQLVSGGEFRGDLFHRLSVFRIDLPPLRERPEDIEPLVHQFMAEYSARSGKRVHEVPDPVWRRLRSYGWPGNVRELRNVIERSVLLAQGSVLPAQWLQLEGEAPVPVETPDDVVMVRLDGSQSLDKVEEELIRRTLDRTDHNVSEAARVLGISRQTLRYRIEKHGLGRT